MDTDSKVIGNAQGAIHRGDRIGEGFAANQVEENPKGSPGFTPLGRPLSSIEPKFALLAVAVQSGFVWPPDGISTIHGTGPSCYLLVTVTDAEVPTLDRAS